MFYLLFCSLESKPNQSGLISYLECRGSRKADRVSNHLILNEMRVLSSFIVLFIVVGMTSCSKDQPDQDQSAIVKKLEVGGWPKIVFGTKSKPCGTGGENDEDPCYCSGEKGICLVIEPQVVSSAPESFEPNEGYGQWNVRSSATEMDIVIHDAYDLDTSSVFEVYEDINLPTSVASELGYSSVVIEAGEYDMDYLTYQHGSVVVNVNCQ